MINHLLATTALCARLMTLSGASSVQADLGAWTIACEPNAEMCRASQTVFDRHTPEAIWFTIDLFRSGSDYRMVIHTPPLAIPDVHLTVDGTSKFDHEATCDEARCELVQFMNKDSLRVLVEGDELEIEVPLAADWLTSLKVDLRHLKEALKRLPVTL